MFFDPLYFLFLAPGMLLAMWAQWRVKSAYAMGSQVGAASGITGAQAAAHLLEVEGLGDVRIEQVQGFLTDHYDPRSKVLRLSPENYSGRSLAALGVSAHEAGHAIQDAHRYYPLVFRNLLVPAAGLGSNLSFMVFFAGLFLHMTGLVIAGLALFSAVVLFQLVNLPVEFDASSRARHALQMTGLITTEEDRTVGKVLNAAAWTYVAGTLTSVLTLLYFLMRSGLLDGGRGRSRD